MNRKPQKLRELFSIRPLELAWWLVAVAVIASGALWHLNKGTARGDSAAMLARIDLNSADKEALMLLPGMSSRKAQAILRERQKRGGFKRAAELAELPGMTPAYLRRIEELIEVK